MKKFYSIFAALIIFLSAGILSACGGTVNITVTPSTQEYSIHLKLKGENDFLTYEDGKGFTVKKGKTVQAQLTLSQGYDQNAVQLHANNKQLTLTKGTGGVLFGEFKADANTQLEVKNLKLEVHSVKIPTTYSNQYTFLQGTTAITESQISITHGENLTLKIRPNNLNHHEVPNMLTYNELYGSGTLAVRPHLDMYLNVIKDASGAASYTIKNVQYNLNLGLSFEIDGWLNVKPVEFNLANNTEYKLTAVRYDLVTDSMKAVEPSVDFYESDLYFKFEPISDFAQALVDPTLIVNNNEYLAETVGFYKGYYKLPKHQITNQITAYIKEKTIEENPTDTFTGTFTNHLPVINGVNLKFTRDNEYYVEYTPACYTYDGISYLKVGDSLIINEEAYGDKVQLISNHNATFSTERGFKFREYGTRYTKFTITQLQNDFELELKITSTLTLPYRDWENIFKIEYRIGNDLDAHFTEITSYEDRIITVENFNAVALKITPMVEDAHPGYLTLSTLAELVQDISALRMQTLSWILRNYDYTIVLPDQTAEYYVILFLLDDTVVTT